MELTLSQITLIELRITMRKENRITKREIRIRWRMGMRMTMNMNMKPERKI